MTSTPFTNMRDVIAANEAAGQFWFSRDTKRFFHSQVETILYRGRWFITSEATEAGGPRAYSVRYARDDGDIDTIGAFMAHTTIKSALDAMWADINQKGEGHATEDAVGGQAT